MGAGLHINHVSGFLGVKRSLTGSGEQRVRALRYFQSSDFVIAGGAPLPQKQTLINFFSEEARPFAVWRQGKRVVRCGGQGGWEISSLGTAAGKRTVKIFTLRGRQLNWLREETVFTVTVRL